LYLSGHPSNSGFVLAPSRSSTHFFAIVAVHRPAIAKKLHPHAWLWEPLENDPTFVLRTMFGAKAVYLGGRMMLAFCAGDEPWRGLLVCTSHEHHESLRQEFGTLAPHAILPKWLYLPEAAETFERDANALVALARRRDPRIGITPKPRKSPKARRRVERRPKGLR
jgi:hypothetical protein